MHIRVVIRAGRNTAMDRPRAVDLNSRPAQFARREKILRRIVSYVDEGTTPVRASRLDRLEGTEMWLPVIRSPFVRADHRTNGKAIETEGSDLGSLGHGKSVGDEGEGAAVIDG